MTIQSTTNQVNIEADTVEQITALLAASIICSTPTVCRC